MQYSESLLWILDKIGVQLNTLEIQTKVFQENIDFVHSLGLRCDSVGWCKLDLSNPRTPKILNSISKFCRENGWQARGLYTRWYTGFTSEWYELVPTYFKDQTLCDRIETLSENSDQIYTRVIRAFYEPSAAPKQWGDEIFVPERFRNFCLQNKIDDLDFCWAKDKGKYEAEQYFHVYGKHLIPRLASNFGMTNSTPDLIQAAGGHLPEIAEVFHRLQQINLQDCYLQSDLPAGGIAYVYLPATLYRFGRHRLLIHRDLCQALLAQKILPASALQPAPVVQTLPGGYTAADTQPLQRPAARFMEQMLSEYEKLKRTPRPVRMVSEKDALKLLRLAKKERKGDFQKALRQANLPDNAYSAVLPYYAVANGGYLSDEYELLSITQAAAENEALQQQPDPDGLLDPKPDGIVIAKCADADRILLRGNGEVIRFSHEAPEITAQWPSLAQFITEALSE